MFLSDVTDRGAAPALIRTMGFTEARLKMIAENVANLHTPGYRAKQLDVVGFQEALGEALAARATDPARPFAVNSGREVVTDERGVMHVTPSETPVEHTLFHDGTNASIERQMADLAETGLAHELASALFRDRMATLRKSIRGTV